MSEGFACWQCEGSSVVLPRENCDDAHVTCRKCGALMGTMTEFRGIIESELPRRYGAPLTGC